MFTVMMPNNQSPLISAEEAAKKLNDQSTKFFDVRGRWGEDIQCSRQAFLSEHITGARFLDWTKTFVNTDLPIALAPVAEIEQAQADFAALGINQDDLVILYDDYFHMFAGRVWWAMRYWGFHNVRVLDGGLKRWKSLALPTSNNLNSARVGNYVVKKEQSWIALFDDVLNRSDNTVLLDARRSENFFASDVSHIPGAINVPFATLLDSDTGMFKAPEEIKQVIEVAINGQDIDHVISSCGSGYAGTILLIALQLIGIDSTLYDGSYAEWKELQCPSN
ncbi:sulfurtransferase [Vibrio campbellii]|uniref:Sulfurtransferase n=1 Tax=Vibrio campbellii TaxID=680 RepID=A0ABY5IIM3_9VIBR|nr:rhodanese-like domain-containing protein [Vibrio campbellii]UTZ23886.1 sulfurtransferase [Vibrio campbellii]UTZ33979.1 sulfurtransferase [Vibrio campbellii]UTZ43665.1 sulfurtransferase [Vibrio campbellii]